MERLTRRGVIKNLLTAGIGGAAGLASSALTEKPIYDPRVPQIQQSEIDIMDRLLLTNERLSKVSSIVLDHDRKLKELGKK